MDIDVILAFAAALVAGAIAIAVAWYERRSVAHWAFVAGMVVLAAESLFSGMVGDAGMPAEAVYWQNWTFFALSLVPSIWLFFSLSYARGNYEEFLAKWRLALVLTLLGPVGLAILCREKLILAIGRTSAGDHWILRLGGPGIVLHLLFLLSAILVLMNLERTFRSSVGTMRWRIKFMILGLGVLFAARAYSSSQVLLFRAV